MSGAHFPKLKALHAVFGLDCPYSDAERGVAAVLILDRNDESGHAYRRQDGIAARTGLSRRTVQRALDSLSSRVDGPLVVRRIAQGGRADGSAGRAANHYAVELRATVTRKVSEVARHRDAQPDEGLRAKPEGVVRQTMGGLSVTMAQDLCMDLSTDRSTPVSLRSAVGFSLSSPGQKSERAKRQPGPTKAKPEAKWPGAHAELVAYYFEAFARARGAKPIFNGREAKAVAKLIDDLAGDIPRCKQLIDNGLANWVGATIVSIAADPSKAVTRHAVNGRRPPVQQTGVGADALFEGAQVIR